MKQLIFIALCIFTLVACKPEGVKKEVLETSKKQSSKVDSLELKLEVIDEEKLDNGLEIKWIEKSNGESIKAGDVLLIDYKVRLADSTIIDGNHLLNKPYLPYMVGFGFQPAGWDLAFEKMRVGDFARIKIPAKLARGDKEVKNLIPKNSDNYLTIRILSKKAPTKEIDGVKIWLLEENKLQKARFNDKNSIEFFTTASSPSHPFYFNSYATNQPFRLKLADHGIVPGLKKALINAKKGDRMYIYVPAKEAYDTKGYLDLVLPNEPIFYNLLVTDILD